MKKLSLLIICLSFIFLVSCRNMGVTNTNFKSKYKMNSSKKEKKGKAAELEKNIKVVKEKSSTFYFSNKDSFVKDKAYTFYISPYIVKESGLVNRTSLSIFAKVVSDQEDIFDKVTLYDEKGNKVLIEFPNIKRDYVEDSYFIEESAHGVIDNKDLKIFEKFIDSKELYVIFEKSNKYPIKLPYPVRNAILDVIRKYKLMQES